MHLIAQGSDVHLYLSDPLRRAAILDAVKRATSVITRSVSLASSLQRAGATESPVHPITNGVDTECFRLRDQTVARAGLGVSGTTKMVLFVGNLLPVKDPSLLLQSFAQLVARDAPNDWQLVLIGKGPLKHRLEQLAAALGIAKRVRFTGPLAADQVAQWMSAADVLCLTSWNEGLPNVVLEALACGLPVVATNVGGIAEAIDAEWKGQLCDSRSPIDIAQALHKTAVTADPASIAARATRPWSAAADAYHQCLTDSLS
jgi:glycosyltransferase involved in cell wall biosynthesis